jgi:TrmH family RNA methyltransferase
MVRNDAFEADGGLGLFAAQKNVGTRLSFERRAIEYALMCAAQKVSDNLRIVLVDTRNPLNIGAAARAVSNFGFAHFRLVHPYDVAFQGARSAVGAAKILELAEVYETLTEAIADCSLVVGTTAVGHRELHLPLRRLEAGARIIHKHLAQKHSARGASKKPRKAATSESARVALLFGSEKYGLSNEDLSHCHWLMRIPTREEHISMNLGQAVSICLYELIRDAKTIAKFERLAEKAIPANAGEVERFTKVLSEALSLSGFLDRRTVADADDRIRRLVRRLKLPQRDADMWTGIMRQIVWKLNHPTTSKPGRE